MTACAVPYCPTHRERTTMADQPTVTHEQTLTEDIVDAFSARPVPAYEDARRAAERLLRENVIIPKDQLAGTMNADFELFSYDTPAGPAIIQPHKHAGWDFCAAQHEAIARGHLAVAHQFRAEAKAAAENEERELQRRRDDLTFELVNERPRQPDEVAARYADAIPVLRRAVDRIIEAEDAR